MRFVQLTRARNQHQFKRNNPLTPQKSSSALQIFAAAAPGLEPLVAAELAELGIANAQAIEGGVNFTGTLTELYTANLWLRVASRVVVRVADFHADSFHELERRVKRIEWKEYLRAGSSVSFRVTCRKSRLYHSDAVAERFAEAMKKQVGDLVVRLSSDDRELNDEPQNEGGASTPSQLFVVRITHDNCVVSIDSSGALLHRRGYRLATGKAPLRETLAAAMVMASGWDLQSPFIDPMCGSGTIPIEAALLARRIPPGFQRVFSFQQWPNYRPKLWESLIEKSAESRPEGPIGLILASDRDDGVVKSAEANSARAGVAADIEFTVKAISGIEPPRAAGNVVTNPPYGARVGERSTLRNLYAQFGKVLRLKADGYSLGLLSADRSLEAMLGIPLREIFRTQNGGIPVRFMGGRVH